SPFQRRPVALKREDGAELDAAILARPLATLLQDADCKDAKDLCAVFADVDPTLAKAREAALRLDWVQATEGILQARTKFRKLFPPCDVLSYPWPLAKEKLWGLGVVLGRLSTALDLASGLQVVAEANGSNLVEGEEAVVTVAFHCRYGVDCPVKPRDGVV